jgi:aspartyl-tRNA synthetase
MAFVSWGEQNTAIRSNAWRIGGTEVRDVIESLIRKIWQDIEGIQLPSKFKVMTYHDAMRLVSLLSSPRSPRMISFIVWFR